MSQTTTEIEMITPTFHPGHVGWWWWGCEADRIRHQAMSEEESRAETRRICAKVNAEMAERAAKRGSR